MPLKFKGAWRFKPPSDGAFVNEQIPAAAVSDVIDLIMKVGKKGTLIKNTKFFLPPLLPELPSRGQMPPSPNAQERPPSKSLSPDLNEK